MRIAVISTPFVDVPPRDYGGTELVVYELAEGLTRRGHEVVLFATGESRTSAELRWLYPRAQWPPAMLPDVEHVAWALAQVRAEGFDLVQANSAATLAMGRLVPEVPIVYTLHHARDAGLSAFYRRFPEAWYVAISADQRSREVLVPHCDVIHHGLDPANYRVASRAEDYVCFVGRFACVKGPHTAIDAAARAGVRIRVAGEVHPVDREFGAREVEPRLARPHVEYLGRIGLREKAPLLAGARALLAPIEWDEPFGLALIEAMLSGCPVVAYGRGSVRELVEEGVTGFIARDADHLVALIRHGGPLDDFDRAACRARAVKRFSADRMVRDYERLFERVLRAREAAAAAPAGAAVAPIPGMAGANGESDYGLVA